MLVLPARLERVIAMQISLDGTSEQANPVHLVRKTRLVLEPHRTIPPSGAADGAEEEGTEEILETKDGALLVTSKLNSRQRMRQRVRQRKVKEINGEEPASAEDATEGPRPVKRQRLLNQGELEEWNYHKELEPLLLRDHSELLKGLKSGTVSLVENKELLVAAEAEDSTTEDFKRHLEDILTCMRDSGRLLVLDGVAKGFRNPSDNTLLCKMSSKEFETSDDVKGMIIPPKSTFLISDLRDPDLRNYLDAERGTLDLVLMDPPWPNRSAERKGNYSLLSRWDANSESLIKDLGFLGDVVRPGGVIGVWCTNRAAHRKATMEFLVSLGFKVVEEWIWGKVTPTGQWTVPLTNGIGNGRRPYEIMIVGRKARVAAGIDLTDSSDLVRRIVFAVPEAEHSRKPRGWNDLVAKRLFPGVEKGQLDCMELFARDLKPGWTSFGNEPLKFQDMALWEAEEGPV